jgi:putative transposase
MKLRLYPTKNQKKILQNWSDSARLTYNKTIETFKNKKNNCINWMRLRNRFVTAKNIRGGINSFFMNKSWLLDTPKSIRLDAVKQAHTARKSCLTNLKNKNIGNFDIGFKTKKNELAQGWCMGIEKNNVQKIDDKLYIFKKDFGRIRYGKGKKGNKKNQLHKLIPENKPSRDCRIQKDKFGDFYIILVHDVDVKKCNKIHESVVSYDPGVKNYLTGYSPDGTAFIIAKDCDKKLFNMLKELDKIISKLSKARGRKRHTLKKISIKLRKKIHNMKHELHNQVNNFVAKKSSLILYPKLDAKKLTRQDTRQLTTKTARSLLNLGHCTALEKLQIKCLEHGSLLLIPSEAYTTQTCSCCGKRNLCTNDRLFICRCGYIAERDLNAGQNILLRSLA